MKNAVVIDAVRTPVGRAHPDRGVYRHTRSDDLASACVQALLERTQIDPQQIEDLVMGNTQQTLEQGMNVARAVGLMSGLNVATGGTTVNRLCGSSLQAINQASHAIAAGAEDVHIVGGLEHMQHVSMMHAVDINPKLFRATSKGAMMMGITAEFLAQTLGISRKDQDEFACASHHKAARAEEQNKFDRERIEIYGHDEEGNLILLDHDQCVRADTSMEVLAGLDPAFMPKVGTVTAGNSSPLNDGAAAMLIMSGDKAKELGLKPMARVVASAVVGVDPCVMGSGPVPATEKALKRAGLQLSDIGLIELNEAFAAQALYCVRKLGMDLNKVNVNGGAIAIGHPLGASGARIATTLLHTMQRDQVQFGLATMCIGVGQGIATIFELVS
ncbi:MAG TPA: acetyl-CoA C-acyltransferase FadA [Planctomycetaceae bacterium]|nr:acetyl-CoA C-acyltransferase FadA [Planctomycetaceae bacterium]